MNAQHDLSTGEAVTIYTNGVGGFGWQKLEGKWGGLDRSILGKPCSVRYTRKRCRRESTLMTFYNPTILVARGHGLPDLRGNFRPAVVGQGGKVTTSKGRHNSCSPEWKTELAQDTAGVTFALQIAGA